MLRKARVSARFARARKAIGMPAPAYLVQCLMALQVVCSLLRSLLRSLVVSSTVPDTTDISEPMTAGFDAIKGCQWALSTPAYET